MSSQFYKLSKLLKSNRKAGQIVDKSICCQVYLGLCFIPRIHMVRKQTFSRFLLTLIYAPTHMCTCVNTHSEYTNIMLKNKIYKENHY